MRDAVLHIFGFLKNKYNSWMCFDPAVPYCDERAFKQCYWKDFYGDVKERLSRAMHLSCEARRLL